ncbi:hypothetical protein G6F68_015572 [Rhizopus microsporus]|nr:hypothetical protein G6F68_015572 [Rhizopus microsporus]
MAAAARDLALEAVRRRHHRPGVDADRARPQARPIMQRVDRVTRKRVEQAVLKHGARTAPALFGRLENQHGRAVEIARLRQVLRRPDQHRGVAVMTATVHQARLGGLVTEVVILGHGQGVHVGAQHDCPVRRAVLDHPDYAGLGDAGVRFDAPAAQRVRHHLGCPVLFVAELGMHVDIAPQRHNFVQIG